MIIAVLLISGLCMCGSAQSSENNDTAFVSENESVLTETSEALVSTIAVDKTTGVVPFSVNFTGESVGYTADLWQWFLDDDMVPGTEQNFSHVFTVPGEYVITLNATDTGTSVFSTTSLTIIAEENSTPPAIENSSDVLMSEESSSDTLRMTSTFFITHPKLWSVSPITGIGNYSEISHIPEIGDGDTIRIWGAEGHTYEGGITISAPNVILEQWEGSPVRPLITATTDKTSTLTIMANNVTLRGLDISNNHHSPVRGGGVYVGAATLTIEDSIIDNNTASQQGGGVCVYEDSTLIIRDTAICNNTAGINGGGVFVYMGSTLTIRDATIHDNTANHGGGVDAESATLTIENTTIHHNKAYLGGGVYANSGLLTIRDATIYKNTVNGGGGGVYVLDVTSTIEKTTICNNTAKNNSGGGGVFVSGSTLTIGETTIHDNTAIYGGGIYARDSKLTLRNNLFSNEKNFDAYTTSSYAWDAVFNQTLLLKENIVGGPYCGGNVWASPAGTGFSETAKDANFDGICDENITFTEMSLGTPPVVGTDELPLVYNSSRGTLTIETDPAGAILFVDKRDISRTTDAPAALYLPTGTHTILAKKDNLVNTARVTVSAGEKRALALTLEEAQMTPIISASPVQGLAPLHVVFNGSAAGNIEADTWNWTFYDGEATSRNATHTFSQVGIYSVVLNASNIITGFSNEISREITVLMSEPVLALSPDSGEAPQSIALNVSSRDEPTAWNLSLGDGRWINATTSDALNQTVTYPQAGEYTLNLNVSENGCSNETSQTIAVSMPEPVLSVSPDSRTAPLDVTIQTGSQGGQPTAWNLSLGDGRWVNSTTSDALNQTVTYQQAGEYTLTLNVSANGCSNETSKTIAVSMPEPVLSVSPDAGTAPLGVTIQAESQGGEPIAWNLSLGDGRWINTTSSDEINQTVTYPQAGDYTLTLNVSANGCSNETSQAISVSMPEPTLSLSPKTGPASLDVRIQADSFGQPTAWILSLGDGRWINTTSSDAFSRTITYPQAGDYTLYLNVSANGYYNETSQAITVSMPEPTISLSPKTGTAPLDVRVEVYSSGQPTAWNLSLGDGTWINTTSPDEINRMITYPEAGEYTLYLNVSTNGYYSERSEVVKVSPPIPSSGSGGPSHAGICSVSDLKSGERISLKFKSTAVTDAIILPAADMPDLMVTIEKRSGPENGMLPPDGEIYQYDLVNLYKADASDITEINYTFRIPKDWLDARNALPSLWWYDAATGDWTEYAAEITGTDTLGVICEVTCPGAGWIALGGVAGDTPVARETPEVSLTPADPGSPAASEEQSPMPEATASPVGYAGIIIGMGAAALIRRKIR